ncbi:MAG: S-layer homology domain-containing protein [Dethiosulfatibacter sp.]|nr:S-layer homology domain-containing protein [Dethiosulfatibacter sp.]
MNANAMETASDISGHWAEETIQEWIDNDWVKGYLDGSFKPDDYITRAEFVALVNRSFQFTATGSTSFTDVNQNAWYASAVGIAVRAGYIQGYNDNTMRPENHISREEAATIIMKINNLSANSTAANVFTDSGLLTWSRGAVGAVAAVNLMTGYPDGTFGPDRMIRRGETVVLLDRSVKYIDEMDAPAAPDVTRDDSANTVTGMTSAMEYKLDDGNWTSYVASVFDDLDLSGNHTLLVRYEAMGILPSGMITTLTFTTTSSGGGGNNDIVVTSVNVSGSAIVGTTLSAITVPVNATGNYQWSIATTEGAIYTNITGATDVTYVPVSADATQYIKVTFIAYGNYTGTVTSDAIRVVLNVAEANQAAATTVDVLIAALPTTGLVELIDAAQIEATRVAFDLLTPAQVLLMTETEATLIAAEAELQLLVDQAAATATVVTAEGLSDALDGTNQVAINAAQTSHNDALALVNALEAGTVKDALIARLVVVQDEIDAAQVTFDVAAVMSLVVDGTVTVAIGAEQVIKTAAVQTYVNGLIAGTDFVTNGGTATVTHDALDVYDVEFNLNAVTETKTITMVVTEE